MNTDNDIEMVINRAERKDEIKYLVKYRDKPHSSNKWVHSVRVPAYLIREFRENPPDIDVVALVDTRRRGGVIEYKCRYRWHPESDDTWDPLEVLIAEGYRHLIDKFHQRRELEEPAREEGQQKTPKRSVAIKQIVHPDEGGGEVADEGKKKRKRKAATKRVVHPDDVGCDEDTIAQRNAYRKWLRQTKTDTMDNREFFQNTIHVHHKHDRAGEPREWHFVPGIGSAPASSSRRNDGKGKMINRDTTPNKRHKSSRTTNVPPEDRQYIPIDDSESSEEEYPPKEVEQGVKEKPSTAEPSSTVTLPAANTTAAPEPSTNKPEPLQETTPAYPLDWEGMLCGAFDDIVGSAQASKKEAGPEAPGPAEVEMTALGHQSERGFSPPLEAMDDLFASGEKDETLLEKKTDLPQHPPIPETQSIGPTLTQDSITAQTPEKPKQEEKEIDNESRAEPNVKLNDEDEWQEGMDALKLTSGVLKIQRVSASERHKELMATVTASLAAKRGGIKQGFIKVKLPTRLLHNDHWLCKLLVAYYEDCIRSNKTEEEQEGNPDLSKTASFTL